MNVLFGAGKTAFEAIQIIGKENIEYIVDNDEKKAGSKIDGLCVHLYQTVKDKLDQYRIIVSVSEKYMDEITKQLDQDGFNNYVKLQELKFQNTRKKINNQFDGIACYKKAISWILNNSLDSNCIICNSNKKKGYPEVTGYYIPSLIRWGYRDLAENYANWLVSIQQEDGSWMDTDGNSSYIFDTAQILKGLLAVRKIYHGDISIVDESIISGCEWILSRMTECGRLITPSTLSWGTDEKTCSELIHLYCLSPIKEAGEIYGKQKYIEAVRSIFDYYQKNYYDKIMNFDLLSHFYAYVMEALIDLGYEDMCKNAMLKIEKLQKESGAVPAYNDVDWVCSTGLFQLALVWYRLGDLKRANSAFSYACKLQNSSGGWYGSYLSEENSSEENTYFSSAEISWANKYFLDALYYKMMMEFNMESNKFMDTIEDEDGRYKFIHDICKQNDFMNVLDLGCGKGRYIKKLSYDFPNNRYFAVDISEKVLDYINDQNIEKKIGTCTNIPYKDDSFDIVYTCEALEHAIDIESSLSEMARVTKKGGHIVIVDKNIDQLGKCLISSWEQWFDVTVLKSLLMKFCTTVDVYENVQYEDENDNLFCIWDGIVK